jgi:hypothetical protein
MLGHDPRFGSGMGHAEGAFGQQAAEKVGQPEGQYKGVCGRAEQMSYE